MNIIFKIITFLMIALCSLSICAQSYKMVVTKSNGEILSIPTDLVEDVKFIPLDKYSITWNIENVETSSTENLIDEGMPFVCTIMPLDGYYIQSISIFMGSSDISDDYSNGVLNIPEVTGDVIINAIAKKLNDGIDLSANGVSNCYIISDIGTYKFSVKDYAGSVAFLMWNELGDTDISDVELRGDYVYFTKNAPNEGNALISLKNKEGEIIWSWHIWSTDEPNYITVNGVKWMDRNIGATDTTPGSLDVYGLHFNPGNPNPFPGAKYGSFQITDQPSVPEGWYVAEGYGFYSSSEMPGPDKPMQLCNNVDKFGNSIYFRNGYSQVPAGCSLPYTSTMQEMMGYEPHIEKGGVYVTSDLFIPCNSPNMEYWEYGEYLCTGIYNTSAVDTYSFFFYEGVSKSSHYCSGAALLPIRCCKWY